MSPRAMRPPCARPSNTNAVKVTRSGDGFAYTPFEVAKRIFDAPKMNLYPIPQAEIVKSGGVLDQNPGW